MSSNIAMVFATGLSCAVSRSKAAAFLVACLLVVALPSRAAPLGVTMRTSGVPTFGSSPIVGTVHWIDRERVLFVGAKHVSSEARDLGRYLYVWNVSTNETKTIAELGNAGGGLCYDGGYVRYVIEVRGKPAIVKAGILGSEVALPPAGENYLRTNPFTCRGYDENKLKTKFGPGGFWPLRDAHGYWGAREGMPQGQTLLIAPDGQREMLLRIPYAPPPRWSAYQGKYEFRRSESLLSATKTSGKIWLLAPSGETTEMDIPAGPWFGGSTGYAMTMRGLFMFSHAIGSGGNGDAGGYLMEEGEKPRRFVSGYIYGYGVSPDGCRIALNINLDRRSKRGPEMIAAQVCSKGN